MSAFDNPQFKLPALHVESMNSQERVERWILNTLDVAGRCPELFMLGRFPVLTPVALQGNTEPRVSVVSSPNLHPKPLTGRTVLFILRLVSVESWAFTWTHPVYVRDCGKTDARPRTTVFV